MATKKNDLKALRNLISEAHTILETTTLPEGRAERACELLNTAVKLADHLLGEGMTTAKQMGTKGGAITAKKYGPEHYAKIAAMRKTRAGGRPRKTASN